MCAQIRNRGTIGGNLGTASPAGDALPPLLVEGSDIELASVRGSRRLPLQDFLLGVKQSALADDELIVAVHLRPSGARQTFMKVGPRNAMVIAVCSLALTVDLDREELRAAIGSAAPVATLVLAPLEDAAQFPELVAAAASPIDDVRGTADYRRHALRVLTARALERCSGMKISLTVNGEPRECDVWGGESLLYALRERLELPGSKNACEQGECGSCSVLLDGTLVCACLVLAAQADGHEIATVEGLASGGEPAPRAGGLRRRGRGAVRLLHAGARRRSGGAARARRRTRATTRSARRCRATSAAAPGTRRSSTRCGPRVG